MTNIVSN